MTFLNSIRVPSNSFFYLSAHVKVYISKCLKIFNYLWSSQTLVKDLRKVMHLIKFCAVFCPRHLPLFYGQLCPIVLFSDALFFIFSIILYIYIYILYPFSILSFPDKSGPVDFGQIIYTSLYFQVLLRSFSIRLVDF